MKDTNQIVIDKKENGFIIEYIQYGNVDISSDKKIYVAETVQSLTKIIEQLASEEKTTEPESLVLYDDEPPKIDDDKKRLKGECVYCRKKSNALRATCYWCGKVNWKKEEEE